MTTKRAHHARTSRASARGPPFTPTTERMTEVGNAQRLYEFENGYGASVVIGPYSYGGKEGFFELAVLGKDGHLDYSTPVTNDVIGWLTEEKVQKTLTEIAALPRPSWAPSADGKRRVK